MRFTYRRLHVGHPFLKREKEKARERTEERGKSANGKRMLSRRVLLRMKIERRREQRNASSSISLVCSRFISRSLCWISVEEGEGRKKTKEEKKGILGFFAISSFHPRDFFPVRLSCSPPSCSSVLFPYSPPGHFFPGNFLFTSCPDFPHLLLSPSSLPAFFLLSLSDHAQRSALCTSDLLPSTVSSFLSASTIFFYSS